MNYLFIIKCKFCAVITTALQCFNVKLMLYNYFKASLLQTMSAALFYLHSNIYNQHLFVNLA